MGKEKDISDGQLCISRERCQRLQKKSWNYGVGLGYGSRDMLKDSGKTKYDLWTRKSFWKAYKTERCEKCNEGDTHTHTHTHTQEKKKGNEVVEVNK